MSFACPMCGAARKASDLSCPACGERFLDPLIHSPYADQRKRIRKALRVYRRERIPLIVTTMTIFLLPQVLFIIQVISEYRHTGPEGVIRSINNVIIPYSIYVLLSVAPVMGAVQIAFHQSKGASLLYRGLWGTVIASILPIICCWPGAVIFIPLTLWANRFQQATAYLTVHKYDLGNLPEV